MVERRDKSISLWFTFSVIWTDMIARESGIHRLAVDLEEMRFGAHIASFKRHPEQLLVYCKKGSALWDQTNL